MSIVRRLVPDGALILATLSDGSTYALVHVAVRARWVAAGRTEERVRAAETEVRTVHKLGPRYASCLHFGHSVLGWHPAAMINELPAPPVENLAN
jgi:hypothetical protein